MIGLIYLQYFDCMVQSLSNKVFTLYEVDDVTAAPFLVYFFAAGSWEKDTEHGAAVTSLRTFIRSNGFTKSLFFREMVKSLLDCF